MLVVSFSEHTTEMLVGGRVRRNLDLVDQLTVCEPKVEASFENAGVIIPH